MMTSRERVLCALNHEEPDRVPVFFGACGSTSMILQGYERLKTHLGIESETTLLSKAMQYVRLDKRVMEHFGADGWPLYAKAAPSKLTRIISEKAFNPVSPLPPVSETLKKKIDELRNASKQC